MIAIDTASSATIKSGMATAMVSGRTTIIAVAVVNVKAVIHAKTSAKAMENAIGAAYSYGEC